MSQTCDYQKRFTGAELAADWRELMVPQRTMQPSIACVREQLAPQSNQQTYHRTNQPH